MYLAIDFGTSFTSAAVVQAGQAPVVIKNIHNEGAAFFPSVFLVDASDKTICGSPAEKQSRRFPDLFIKEIKLKIAKEYIDHQGKKLPIEKLIGGFLQHIKAMAEAQLTQSLNLSIVVITIPVSYDENEKKLMTKAAELAGFTKVEFLEEPTAAGLFHIIEEDLGKKLAVGENILIYDLGGGTFDTSVVQKKSANYCKEVKSLGNSRCGGSDFDACIYNYITQKIPNNFQMSPSNEVLLSQLVTLFKHELSISESYGDIISFLPNDYSVELSRKEFEEMLAKEKYLAATHKLVQDLINDHEVSYILLVGGSSRIPYVSEQLKQFGKPIHVSRDPQLAVAKGAAYYGSWLANDAHQFYQQEAIDLFANNDFDAKTITQAVKSVDRSLELQSNHYQSRVLKGELLGIRGLVEMRSEWQKVPSGSQSQLIGAKKSTLLSKYLSLYAEVFSVDKKIPLAEPQPKQNLSLDLGNGISLEMVYIPGGVFMMGAATGEADASADEFPQHSVTVKSFYMAKYPVTQGQYQQIMNANPATFSGEKRPVETVTWYDAKKFCDKVAKLTSKLIQLPSEAQWEYACRAGTTTPFSFGSTITPDLVNYDGNYPYGNAAKGVYREETTDVGSFAVNLFGLCDMHGNVWEWCLDTWHENYQGAPANCQPWSSGDDNHSRLLRGGSCYGSAHNCRSAVRGHNTPDDRIGIIGFRVALSAQ